LRSLTNSAFWSWRKVVLSTTDPIARRRRLRQTGRHLFNHPSPLAKALGAERQGTGIVPRGERRSGDERQATVGTDAVNRDVVAESVCYADEPPEEVHRQGTGIPSRGERRPGAGRQSTVWTDAVSRDVVAAARLPRRLTPPATTRAEKPNPQPPPTRV
jgi:hypothetical protein